MPLKFKVADDHPKTAAGITVTHREGNTWRVDGKPWHEAIVEVDTFQRYQEIREAGFRTIDLQHKKRTPEELVALADSLWPAFQIKAVLFPDLFGASAGSYQEEYPYYYFTPEQKRARSSAKANISRALRGMSQRGIISSVFCPFFCERNWKWKDTPTFQKWEGEPIHGRGRTGGGFYAVLVTQAVSVTQGSE